MVTYTLLVALTLHANNDTLSTTVAMMVSTDSMVTTLLLPDIRDMVTHLSLPSPSDIIVQLTGLRG